MRAAKPFWWRPALAKNGTKSGAIFIALDGPHLTERLRDYGVHPHEIDIVINTHLHFDHCGGNTRVEKDKVVTAFPHARYVVQRGEYEHAKNPNERDRASYLLENYVPLEAAGKWSLLVDDRAIAPGVELIRVPGHTANMQCVKLSGGGQDSVFLRRSCAHYGSSGAAVDHGIRLVSGDDAGKQKEMDSGSGQRGMDCAFCP